jgi:Bacterial SH3 domain
MNGSSENSKSSGTRRTMIALGSCTLGAVMILLALQIDATPPIDSAKDAAAKNQQKKPHRTWNIALGNVVVVAQDLGLDVKVARGGQADQSKIIARLENQLLALREFYREESEKEPTLMGGMLLQVTVAPDGEVTHVKELASRITQSEFKKAVLSHVSKWTFRDIITDPMVINCPLLFVREGMDIATVVQWEKTLGEFADNPAIAKASAQTLQQAAEGSKRGHAIAKSAAAHKAAQESAKVYMIKHPTAIRREPNFSAPSIGKFAIGTRVTFLSGRGDWLEVRSDDTTSGFIRKEFVTSVEFAQKK